MYYLTASATVYQVSSRVAKVSISAFDNLTDSSNVYCIDLPDQYKGGLIYRNGFEEAVSWLSSKKQMTVIKVSGREMNHPTLSYHPKEIHLNELSKTEAENILMQLPGSRFFNKNDVVFKWTDSLLLVVNVK